MKKLRNSIGTLILVFCVQGSLFAQIPQPPGAQGEDQNVPAPAVQTKPDEGDAPEVLMPDAPPPAGMGQEMPSQQPVDTSAAPPPAPHQTMPAPAQPVQPTPQRQVPSRRPAFKPAHPQGAPVLTAPSPVPGAPGPEAPGRGTMQVEFENEKLNVLAENSTFGEVMNAVAQKARFTLKIPPDLSARKISISIYDATLERAIVRLFSLVQEKNYDVKYGSKGEIERIEVITAKKPKQPGDQRGQQPFPGRGRRYAPGQQPAMPQNIPQPQQPQQPRYIPPQPPSIPLQEQTEDLGADTEVQEMQ